MWFYVQPAEVRCVCMSVWSDCCLVMAVLSAEVLRWHVSSCIVLYCLTLSVILHLLVEYCALPLRSILACVKIQLEVKFTNSAIFKWKSLCNLFLSVLYVLLSEVWGCLNLCYDMSSGYTSQTNFLPQEDNWEDIMYHKTLRNLSPLAVINVCHQELNYHIYVSKREPFPVFAFSMWQYNILWH